MSAGRAVNNRQEAQSTKENSADAKRLALLNLESARATPPCPAPADNMQLELEAAMELLGPGADATRFAQELSSLRTSLVNEAASSPVCEIAASRLGRMLLSFCGWQARQARDCNANSELAEAKATCKLYEETAHSFEDKLLESICECGTLHQDIDRVQHELISARKLANEATRQRDEARQRLADLRAENRSNIAALVSAEQEINNMVQKLGELGESQK